MVNPRDTAGERRGRRLVNPRDIAGERRGRRLVNPRDISEKRRRRRMVNARRRDQTLMASDVMSASSAGKAEV